MIVLPFFTVYVDMGLASTSPITLTVVTASGNSFSRSFSIKVTQIDCNSLNRGTYEHQTPEWHCLLISLKAIFKSLSYQFRKSLTLKKHADTDGNNILNTLLVKHNSDLLERPSSERNKDEISYFYGGGSLCINLGTKYADFQEKMFVEISGKKFQTLWKRNPF